MSKIDSSSWKKFKISELFEIKKVYGRPFSEYESGDTPYVTGAENDNGVVGYVVAPAEAISKGGCISVDPIKGFARYQPVDFVGRGFSGASINLLYNEHLTEDIALYVCTAIEKISMNVAAYTNLFNSDRLANAEISLPVTMEEIPDWDYMQERIAELEQERIAELEQYLVATGLDDYTLTDEDLKILSLSGFRSDKVENQQVATGSRKEMREFQMGNLFEFKAIKQARSQSLIPIDEHGIQYVVQSTRNNMVSKTVNKQWLIDNDEAPVMGNALVLGVTLPAVSYQPYEFGASQVIVARSECMNENNGIYLVAVLEKQMRKFSYTKKPGMTIYKAMTIPLPVRTDALGQPIIDSKKTYHSDGFVPDWDYMSAYIKAIEKIVVKDVVNFKDAFIVKTKAVVGGSN